MILFLMKQEKILDECKIGLGLSIGRSHDENYSHGHNHKLHILFPPRPPPTSEEEKEEEEEESRLQAKRLRSCVDRDHEEDKGGGLARKKLRLTQYQATLLEDAFKEHNTLSSQQKQELAEKLSLRPRQVEVWFQNRRARNKLKQTEVDFQLLKNWCETLNEENKRLKRELQELKLVKQPEGSTLKLDLPKVDSGGMTLTLCPSCKQAPMSSGKKSTTSGDSSICLLKE